MEQTLQGGPAASDWRRQNAAGLGTERDYGSAALWFEKSASQNYETALQLYEQAAIGGFPYAAWELAKLYRDGVGTAPDERLSARYFAAAFRGFIVLEDQRRDDKLQYRIGWMLLHGVGAERNEAAARHKPDDHEDQGIVMR